MTLFKNRNFVSKEFMTTSIHVLHSNFTEIVRREVSETVRCFGDKRLRKMRFSSQRSPKVCRGAFHVSYVTTSFCKISSQSIPIYRSYSGKSDFV